MYAKRNEAISAQCFNATFQGFFDRALLRDEQNITGTGIVIDDQFNFFMSDWHEGTLNGYSFIRLISGPIIYGFFEKNFPVGAIAYTHGKYKLFISRVQSKEVDSWRKEAVLIDTVSRIFYMLELTHRDQQKSMDLDRTQKIGSESFRAQASKNPWKIKIVDRCGMKNDGKLLGYSKKIVNYSKQIQLKYESGVFSLQQQNHIQLIAAVLGDSFKEPSLITTTTFLRSVAQKNPKICILEERQNEREAALFLSLQHLNHGTSRSNEHKLGIMININSEAVRSLGSYDGEGNLNGIGVKFGRLGDSILGIFRDNLMVKEYCRNKQNSKGVVTFQARELVQNQHLKSLNYINTCFYLTEIEKIVTMGSRIVRYTQAFEKQFQKRHFSYNDTEISQGSETMNVMKYGEQSGARIVHYVEQMDGSFTDIKKPGFIVHKNKSKDRQNSRSPVGTVVRQGSRSPGGMVRQVGKISKGHSPSGRSISGRTGLAERRPAF